MKWHPQEAERGREGSSPLQLLYWHRWEVREFLLLVIIANQPHLANACKNVASVEDRKRILKEAIRCFVCLTRGHIVWQCMSKGRCPYCRGCHHGCHHGSICSSQKPGSGDPPDSGGSVPARTNSAGTNPTAATFQPSTVLLQTAQATTFNPVTPRCLAVFPAVDTIKFFWELESFGITNAAHAVHDDFGTTIQLIDGRYEVQLPWKEGHPALRDNYQLCLKRLRGLMNGLKQDPGHSL